MTNLDPPYDQDDREFTPVDILVDEDGLKVLRRVNLYAVTIVAEPDAPL